MFTFIKKLVCDTVHNYSNILNLRVGQVCTRGQSNKGKKQQNGFLFDNYPATLSIRFVRTGCGSCKMRCDRA